MSHTLLALYRPLFDPTLYTLFDSYSEVEKAMYYTLQGHYGYGWEDLISEETEEEIKTRLREYQDNEGGRYRVKVEDQWTT